MGGLFSYFWGSPVPAGFDEPDKTTGLTPREKKHITDTWALVQKDTKGVGIALFIKFFELYPQHQNFFKAFKDVPLEDLPTNKSLRAHASNVIYAFTAIVDNLADPEALVEMLQTLGTNHARRNVPESVFHDLKRTLMELFKEQLGAAFTDETAKAWDKTLTVAFNTVFTTLTKKP